MMIIIHMVSLSGMDIASVYATNDALFSLYCSLRLGKIPTKVVYTRCMCYRNELLGYAIMLIIKHIG